MKEPEVEVTNHGKLRIDHTKPTKQLSTKTSEQKEAEMFQRLLVDKWKEYKEEILKNPFHTDLDFSLYNFMDWLERNIDERNT
jgi:hypothetical protein